MNEEINDNKQICVGDIKWLVQASEMTLGIMTRYSWACKSNALPSPPLPAITIPSPFLTRIECIGGRDYSSTSPTYLFSVGRIETEQKTTFNIAGKIIVPSTGYCCISYEDSRKCGQQ